MPEETKQTIKEKQRSGGVQTAAGKAISRYNAEKHTILRETITEYEKADAEQIYNELSDSLKPIGRFQELMVENIASNTIRLQRIARAEAELIKETLSPDFDGSRGLKFKKFTASLDVQTIERLELFSRYQTAAENRMYRAISLLRNLKSYEKGE